MKNPTFRILALVLILATVSMACAISIPQPETPTPTAAALRTPTQAAAAPTESPTLAPVVAPPVGDQTYRINGTFSYTNTILERYFVEQAVALDDMHGFVIRNKDWELPVNGQVLGYMKLDTANKKGTFQLDLPLHPEGTFNDVSHRNQNDTGVQIFAVSYQPNVAGGPFAEGDDRSTGWPNYLTSMVTDPENKDEVTGGKLVVWAPDDKQLFPTGFGPDGLLFTADDPVGPLPAGYSVINLDAKPFGIGRRGEELVTLYEPKDIALKDFSKSSFSQAFQQSFDIIRKEYAFNGIAGKQPDWDKLYADLMPRIKDAEAKNDPNAFYLAMHDFTLAFHDGHVGLSGGTVGTDYLRARLIYGYGFAVRELDDGSTIAAYVNPSGSAQAAGMKAGAEIISYNDTPVKDAISAVAPLSPSSTDVGRRYEQAQLLTRGSRNSKVNVTFKNPGQAAQTVSLSAAPDVQSFFATDPTANADSNALPVEFKILPSGIGYVKVNSNFDDLNLILRLFERALQTFENNQVPGIIIDLRVNSGGNPLGLAGFLTNKTILLGQTEYYSNESGKFQADGPRDKFTPMQEQYSFKKMVLLVDQACASACEQEAYGFSQVPGMEIVGMYPTSGTEAEVARGQFQLPDGMSLQVPTGRITLPDGSLFLEGTGVQPTLKVPITAANVLSTDDVVLKIAEQEISK